MPQQSQYHMRVLADVAANATHKHGLRRITAGREKSVDLRIDYGRDDAVDVHCAIGLDPLRENLSRGFG